MSQTNPHSSVDRSERAGSPGMVLLLAVALVAVMAGFSFLPHEHATRLILALLAFLAFIGISALLAYAVGFLQMAGAQSRNDVTKIIADIEPRRPPRDRGRKPDHLRQRDLYGVCPGRPTAPGLRTVDRLFSGAPEVSEPIYRLAQAAREGKRGAEELRLTPPLLGEGEFGWYRIRVRPHRPPVRPAAPPCGPSPTSPASASATKTSSRNCSTRSTFSITRRPASSRPIPTATSPT